VVDDLRKKRLITKNNKFAEGGVIIRDEEGNETRSQVGFSSFETKWGVNAWMLTDSVYQFEEENNPASERVPLFGEKSNKGKIEDFGEKIEGARKELWRRVADQYLEGLPEDVKEITLAKHFPEPDYGKLLEGGAPIWKVAAMKAVRDLVPRKPQSTYKLRRWGEMVKNLHEVLSVLVSEDGMARERFDGIIAQTQAIRLQCKLYESLGFPDMMSAKGWTSSVLNGRYSVYAGKNVEGKKITVLEKEGRYTGIFSEIADEDGAAKELAEKLRQEVGKEKKPAEKDDSRHYGVYGDRLTGKYFVGRKGLSGVVRMKVGFENVQEARSYIKDNAAELAVVWEGMKGPKELRKDYNEPRSGADRRAGDVSPEMFSEAFGFRGVQFGNWVEDGRRQADLNSAFDALMDLAEVLGVKTRALSLDGSLGMAFGARGHGNAMAHYEPSKVVINLTKTKGAGSFAHEWFHALDNYFARLAETGKTAVKALDKWSVKGDAAGKTGAVSAGVVKAIANIARSVNEGAFSKRSAGLDATRAKPYYSQTVEKAARAFEIYVMDRLAKSSVQNDYLVNISKTGMEAYPTAEEMEGGIRQAFDGLLETVNQEETGGGNVKLYSAVKAVAVKPEDERRALTLAKNAYEELPKADQELLDRVAENQINRVLNEWRDKDGFMKAPNGQPTKLNERQWAQVRTPLFKRWFGDWEAVANLGKVVKPVLVDDGVFSGDTIKEIRKEAMEKTRSFWNTRKRNADLDADVLINQKTVEHMMVHKGAEQIYASLHLPEIIRSARKLSDEAHEPETREINRVHRLVSAVQFRGENYRVDIVVKEHSGDKGHHAYDVEAVDLTKKEAQRENVSADGSLATTQMPSVGLGYNLLQLGASVNPESVSKVVDENGEPMVVWHGTDKKFNKFKKGDGELGPGHYFGTNADTRWAYDRGVVVDAFLKADLFELSDYNSDPDKGSKILAERINRDSLPVTIRDMTLEELAERIKDTWNVRDGTARKWLEFAGYGGVTDKNSQIPTQIMVFNPNQIKSATANRGAFTQSGNILHSASKAGMIPRQMWIDLGLYRNPNEFNFVDRGKAKGDLFKDNMGLAGAIAGEYSNIPGIDREDLQQKAKIALLRAAQAYDAERGVQFAGFAGRVIRNELNRVYHSETRRAGVVTDSLDRQTNEGFSVADAYEGASGASVTAGVEQEELAGILDDLIGRLPERPRTAVRDFMEGRSGVETARTLGISKQAVNKMLGNAMGVLKYGLKSRGVTAGDGALFSGGKAGSRLDTAVDERDRLSDEVADLEDKMLEAKDESPEKVPELEAKIAQASEKIDRLDSLIEELESIDPEDPDTWAPVGYTPEQIKEANDLLGFIQDFDTEDPNTWGEPVVRTDRVFGVDVPMGRSAIIAEEIENLSDFDEFDPNTWFKEGDKRRERADYLSTRSGDSMEDDNASTWGVSPEETAKWQAMIDEWRSLDNNNPRSDELESLFSAEFERVKALNDAEYDALEKEAKKDHAELKKSLKAEYAAAKKAAYEKMKAVRREIKAHEGKVNSFVEYPGQLFSGQKASAIVDVDLEGLPEDREEARKFIRKFIAENLQGKTLVLSDRRKVKFTSESKSESVSKARKPIQMAPVRQAESMVESAWHIKDEPSIKQTSKPTKEFWHYGVNVRINGEIYDSHFTVRLPLHWVTGDTGIFYEFNLGKKKELVAAMDSNAGLERFSSPSDKPNNNLSAENGNVNLHASPKPSLESLIADLERDLPSAEEVDRLRKLAHGEEDGKRTIGRPDKANYASDTDTRTEINTVQALREKARLEETEQGWVTAARNMVAYDADGVKRTLLAKALDPQKNGTFTAVEVKAAQLLVPKLMRSAVLRGDKRAQREAFALAWAYDAGGADQARAFAARPKTRKRKYPFSFPVSGWEGKNLFPCFKRKETKRTALFPVSFLFVSPFPPVGVKRETRVFKKIEG